MRSSRYDQWQSVRCLKSALARRFVSPCAHLVAENHARVSRASHAITHGYSAQHFGGPPRTGNPLPHSAPSKLVGLPHGAAD